MTNWWTSFVQLLLCTIWMRSQCVQPQAGHGGHQGTQQGGAQGTQHHANFGDPQGTQHHAEHGGVQGTQRPVETDQFDLDDFNGLPGVQHEFKVDIGAGQSDCFFQWMKSGAQLHVSFEVLRGADRNIDVYIKRPDGDVIEKHLWTSEGNTDTQVQWEGDYAICIDNGFSRFSTKLVYLFIATYVEREWQEFADEAEALDISIKEVQGKVDSLHKRVTTMLQMMGLGRRRSNGDYYLALSNNKTVQTMSIILVIVFIMTSTIQVYFVRHMFKTVNVTPTQKPRA